MTDSVPNGGVGGDFTSAKGGLFGGQFSLTGLDANTAATLKGSRWTTDPTGRTPAHNFTYFYATSSADFSSNYGSLSFGDKTAAQQATILGSFTELSTGQKAAMQVI